MTLFLILINFLAALVGVQLMRGDISGTQTVNFGNLFNSFLAVYQVFSSENWPTVLYDATQGETALGQTVIVALFIVSWLLFANCWSHSHCLSFPLAHSFAKSSFCRCSSPLSMRISPLLKRPRRGSKLRIILRLANHRKPMSRGCGG